jgi:hypothetical protein
MCLDFLLIQSEVITGSPILMLFCIALPLTGLGIGMFKRLLSARG